jgi:hypothetical protein
MSLESIGRAVASGHLSFDFVESLFPQPAPLTETTLAGIANELGAATETVLRLYAMWGRPRPSTDGPVREDDAVIFADIRESLPARVLSDEALTHGARY